MPSSWPLHPQGMLDQGSSQFGFLKNPERGGSTLYKSKLGCCVNLGRVQGPTLLKEMFPHHTSVPPPPPLPVSSLLQEFFSPPLFSSFPTSVCKYQLLCVMGDFPYSFSLLPPPLCFFVEKVAFVLFWMRFTGWLRRVWVFFLGKFISGFLYEFIYVALYYYYYYLKMVLFHLEKK